MARPDAPKPAPLSAFSAPAECARYVHMPPDGLVVLNVSFALHEAVNQFRALLKDLTASLLFGKLAVCLVS